MYRTKPPEKKSQKKSQKNSQRNSPVQFASSTAKYSRKKFTKLLWGSLLIEYYHPPGWYYYPLTTNNFIYP